MSRASTVAVFWLLCTFVIWNVLYDRQVSIAATAFTRAQVTAQQDGRPLTTIHEGFSPQVTQAALRATWLVSPLLAFGALVTLASAQRRTQGDS